MSTNFLNASAILSEENDLESSEENVIIFTFDNRHVEIVKYLVEVTYPGELGSVLRLGLDALTSCFASNKFSSKFKPRTKIGGKEINPVWRTKSANFPKWISSVNVGTQEVFFPLYESSNEKILDFMITSGYKDVNEAMSHLLRFLVLIYKQKCLGEPVYFYRQMTKEEIASYKKMKNGGNYQYWMCNIFDKYKFPFKIMH